MPIRYSTRAADTFAGRDVKRCPVCEFPMNNGFQLVCEPGVCLYHERPIRYQGVREIRKATDAFGF